MIGVRFHAAIIDIRAYTVGCKRVDPVDRFALLGGLPCPEEFLLRNDAVKACGLQRIRHGSDLRGAAFLPIDKGGQVVGRRTPTNSVRKSEGEVADARLVGRDAELLTPHGRAVLRTTAQLDAHIDVAVGQQATRGGVERHDLIGHLLRHLCHRHMKCNQEEKQDCKASHC